MKKLYTLLSALLVCFGLSAQTTGTGEMTCQIDMSMGQGEEPELEDPETYTVEATIYEDGILKIYNMPEGLEPITFTIDLTTGEATAADQIAFIDDYEPDDILTYYYYDFTSGEKVVKAVIENIDEKSSRMIIQPWGEATIIEGWGLFFNVLYYNTEILFNFAIPDLGAQAELPVLTISDVECEEIPTDLYPYAVFTVTVTTENLSDDAEVEVYYFVDNGEEQEAEEVEDGIYTFAVGGVELNVNHTVYIYAQSGNYKSDTKEYTFKLEFSGVNSILNDNENARYYNLNGVEVKNPQQGTPYIKVTSGKAQKVIIR